MNKPRGWGAFDELARRLAAIPKDKVDAKIAAKKAARKRRKRKK